MDAIADRLYALEAAQPPQSRPRMQWRMSRDVAEACAQEGGLLGRTPREFILLGYPAMVDDTLPPDTLLVEEGPIRPPPLPGHDWQFRIEALLTRLVDAIETREDREARDSALERWYRGEGKHPDD